MKNRDKEKDISSQSRDRETYTSTKSRESRSVNMNGERLRGSGEKPSSSVEVAGNKNKNNSNKYESNKSDRLRDSEKVSLHKTEDKSNPDRDKSSRTTKKDLDIEPSQKDEKVVKQKDSDKGANSRIVQKDDGQGSLPVQKDNQKDNRLIPKDKDKSSVQKDEDKTNRGVEKDTSGDKANNESVKEQRRKRFMEEDKADSDKATPPKKLLTSFVSLSSKNPDTEGSSSKSKEVKSPDLQDGKSKSKRRREERDKESAKNKNFTVTIDNKGYKERSVVKERSRSPDQDGRHHTKVVWRDEASKARQENSPPKRLSIHERLGQPVHHKKAKLQRHEDEGRRRDFTVTRRVETTDTNLPRKTIVSQDTPKPVPTVTEPPGHLSDLDARILLIQKKNAEILRRQAEIEQDKERYG